MGEGALCAGTFKYCRHPLGNGSQDTSAGMDFFLLSDQHVVDRVHNGAIHGARMGEPGRGVAGDEVFVGRIEEGMGVRKFLIGNL